MRILQTASLFVCTSALLCCGQSASQDEQPADKAAASRVARAPETAASVAADVATEARPEVQVASAFRGSVSGSHFAPKYAFFLQGRMDVPGEPLATILVQTDNPDLCQHLGAGTMPKGATMFAVVLLQDDGSAAQVGKTYLAPGSRGRDSTLQVAAYYRQLDDSCAMFPAPLGAEADSGQAALRQLVPGYTAELDYDLTLDDDSHVAGHLVAGYCEAPALFANPESLQEPVAPENCR